MKYSEEFKNEVRKWALKTSAWEASKHFKIKHDTVKYWIDPDYREKLKQKENFKYSLKKDDEQFKKKRNEASREYYKNPERKEYTKNHTKKNFEKVKQYKQNWYLKNLDEIKEYKRKRYIENKGKNIEKSKKYRENYKEKRNVKERENYHKNPIRKLRNKIYASIHRALKSNNANKTYSSQEYLGCTVEFFKSYIESQFQEGMTWENNKPYIPNVQENVWHLDHIIPISTLNSQDEEQIKKITHYTNYRPIWAKENLEKNNKFDISKDIELSVYYSEFDQKRELESILARNGTLDVPAVYNKIVLNNQTHFYEKEKELFKDEKIKAQLLENRQKYLFKDVSFMSHSEILLGFRISAIYKGFSHFSPLWFKYFIEKYNPKNLYDPFGGWGHRLIGATGLDTYIYNDFDPRTVEGCKKINEKFNPLQSGKVIFYNKRSETFTPTEDYDSIFTCPPYYNKESYNGKTFKDFKDFTEWFSRVSDKSTKKYTVRLVGIVMSSAYLDIIKVPFLTNGYSLVEESDIYTKKDHFAKNKKVLNTEVLMVFKKN